MNGIGINDLASGRIKWLTENVLRLRMQPQESFDEPERHEAEAYRALYQMMQTSGRKPFLSVRNPGTIDFLFEPLTATEREFIREMDR